MACLTEFQCGVYADGELQAHEVREVEEHLENCRACRQLVGALRVESRVLIETFQSTDFIEFELEDAVLSEPQAHRLGIVRFAAFILAMSVVLRPVLDVLEDMGLRETANWIAIGAAYIVPAGISFLDTVVSGASWIALSALVFLGFILFSRRSVLSNSILSAIALLTVFSSSSYGLDVRHADTPLTVPPGETIDDTLVVTGDSVIIDGTVTGDLIAFVREITIRGRVKGNVVSFARHIELEGTVDGSVFGFAQSVDTRGKIAHNVYAFAQTASIGRDAQIDENATVFAANSQVDGTVGRDVLANVGSIDVSSRARIGGAFEANVGKPENARIAPGSVIGGKTDVRASQRTPSRYSRLSFYVWETIWLTAAFLTGLLVFSLIPAFSRINFHTIEELLVSGGVGLLALCAVPIAAILAAITLVGLPLSLILVGAAIVAGYLAKILIAGFLGRSILGSGAQSTTALVLLTGLVPIFVAINLPYIGALINFLLTVVGLGALVIQTYKMPRQLAAQAA